MKSAVFREPRPTKLERQRAITNHISPLTSHFSQDEQALALPSSVAFELDIERYLLLLNPALQFFSAELVG